MRNFAGISPIKLNLRVIHAIKKNLFFCFMLFTEVNMVGNKKIPIEKK